MNRKEVMEIIMNTAKSYGITLEEDTKNTEWMYWGTYAEASVMLEKTNYTGGGIRRRVVVNVSIARMGRTTSVNMLRAAAELKRVAEFAAEIDDMGLEFVEDRSRVA